MSTAEEAMLTSCSLEDTGLITMVGKFSGTRILTMMCGALLITEGGLIDGEGGPMYSDEGVVDGERSTVTGMGGRGSLGEGEAEWLTVWEADGDEDELLLMVRDPDAVELAVVEAEEEEEALSLVVREGEQDDDLDKLVDVVEIVEEVTLREDEGDCDGLTLAEREGLELGEGEAVLLDDADELGVLDIEILDSREVDTVPDALELPVIDAELDLVKESEELAVTEAEDDCERVGLCEEENDTDVLGLREKDAERERETLDDREIDGVLEGSG